jgi:hypothetical protein
MKLRVATLAGAGLALAGPGLARRAAVAFLAELALPDWFMAAEGEGAAAEARAWFCVPGQAAESAKDRQKQTKKTTRFSGWRSL